MEHEIEEDLPKKPKSLFHVVFAALIASIGGILFGYDIGITSGALLQLKEIFSLSSIQQELVVSSVLIGALCASIFGGCIVDRFGRKTGITVSCICFIVGSTILYFSINFIMLIAGRFIVGLAVSLSVTSECTYISEISPPSHRGMMVSFNEVGITLGFLLAYLMNYIFITVHNGWKYMFGAAAVPAILQAFGVAFMPNSHHFLLIKGKKDEARKVLVKLRNTNDVDEEIESIVTSINEQKNRRYLDLFRTADNMRSRIILGMSLVFLQQFSGNANVLYYAPTVFKHFGYDSNTSATLVTVGLGIVKALSTVITLLIVDKVGRRSLLLAGCLLMSFSIIALGIVGTVNDSLNPAHGKLTSLNSSEFVHTLNKTYNFESINSQDISHGFEMNYTTKIEQNNNLELANRSEAFESIFDSIDLPFTHEEHKNRTSINRYDFLFNNELPAHLMDGNKSLQENITGTAFANFNTTDSKNISNNTTETVSLSTKIISVVSLMTFVCAYSISYGPVTWLILSEIFPGSLRGRAVSVANVVNWGSNIVVSLTFLDILNAVGIGPTFVTYGLISFGAAIFIFFCVPETKNKTLEEIHYILRKGLLNEHWKESFVRKQRKYSLKSISSNVEAKLNNIQEWRDYKQLEQSKFNK